MGAFLPFIISKEEKERDKVGSSQSSEMSFLKDLGKRIRSLDLGRTFGLTQMRSLIRGRSVGGFWLCQTSKGEIMRERGKDQLLMLQT